jgi:hypothetical protein
MEIVPQKKINIYKIIGFTLMLLGLISLFLVADDLRHGGEIMGAASITLAGIIFYFNKSVQHKFCIFDTKWLAFGLIIGLPIGGIVLDNMYLGSFIGILIGAAVGFLFCKR